MSRSNLDHTERNSGRNSGDEHQRGYDWNNVEHIRESIGTAWVIKKFFSNDLAISSLGTDFVTPILLHFEDKFGWMLEVSKSSM